MNFILRKSDKNTTYKTDINKFKIITSISIKLVCRRTQVLQQYFQHDVYIEGQKG